MTVPNLPVFYTMQYTDKDGKLTPESHLYNDQLWQVLNDLVQILNKISTTTIQNGNVTLNGINPPSFTTTEITALAVNAKIGTIWYNSTINKLQFKDSTTVRTITST